MKPYTVVITLEHCTKSLSTFDEIDLENTLMEIFGAADEDSDGMTNEMDIDYIEEDEE